MLLEVQLIGITLEKTGGNGVAPLPIQPVRQNLEDLSGSPQSPSRKRTRQPDQANEEPLEDTPHGLKVVKTPTSDNHQNLGDAVPKGLFEKKANAEGSTKVQERVESRMGCSLSMPISQVV